MVMMNAKAFLSTPGAALLLLLTSPAILTACMHAAQPAAAPADPGMMAMCPMTVPGTQVYAADTANGSALTFTTSPDQVAELRVRVHAMANMHNQRHGGTGGDEKMGGKMTPPPSRAWVEEIDNGARIAMTPNDPGNLLKLQSSVRAHAEHLQRHGCAMQPE
jgi:hypothetical protein